MPPARRSPSSSGIATTKTTSSLLQGVLGEWSALLGDLKAERLLGEFEFSYKAGPTGKETGEESYSEEWEGLWERIKAVRKLYDVKERATKEEERKETVVKVPSACNVSSEESTRHSCRFCPRQFTSEGRLKRHVNLAHLTEDEESPKVKRDVHACKVAKCRKRFASEELLTNHNKVVHGQGMEEEGEQKVAAGDEMPFYCCEHCHKCFRTAEDVNSAEGHAKECIVHKDTAAVRTMASVTLLKSHTRFGCGYCDEDLRQFARMKFHLSRCEGGPFPCELCQESFDERKALNAHKTSQHASEQPFRCTDCPRRFKLNNSLQKHLAASHEQQPKSHRCEKCSKCFSKKVFLTNHQTRFHDLYKPFLCAECGDRFLSETALASHLQLHSGVKRFSCPSCDKAFHRRDKLKFHLQTAHTGERPHRCSLCDKGFVRKSKLQDHLRRHTGDKRYSCLVCNKKYWKSYDVRRHLQRMHPTAGRSKAKANKDVSQGGLTTVAASMRLEASVVGDELFQDALQIDMEELSQACGVATGSVAATQLEQLEMNDAAVFIGRQEF